MNSGVVDKVIFKLIMKNGYILNGMKLVVIGELSVDNLFGKVIE